MAAPIQDIKTNPVVHAAEPPVSSKPARSDRALRNRSVDYQKRIEELSQIIQDGLKVQEVKLNFSVDKSTGMVVIRVIDGESGEVIREIPPEELLALAREMKELTGILYNQEI